MHFPRSHSLAILYHRHKWLIESNAFKESTKKQYNLLPLQNVFCIKEYKQKIALVVLYPFRNPNCASVNTSLLDDHFNDLRFNIVVKSLLRLLMRLIPW